MNGSELINKNEKAVEEIDVLCSVHAFAEQTAD